MDLENDMISKYFSWHEALWLPQWNRMATVEDGLTDQIQENLVKTFAKMDIVREYFGAPIIVHCTFRPPKYNELVGGSSDSQHVLGGAVDFHVKDFGCILAIKKINDEDMLDAWNMRMEQGTSGWIHLDTKPIQPGSARFFKP